MLALLILKLLLFSDFGFRYSTTANGELGLTTQDQKVLKNCLDSYTALRKLPKPKLTIAETSSNEYIQNVGARDFAVKVQKYSELIKKTCSVRYVFAVNNIIHNIKYSRKKFSNLEPVTSYSVAANVTIKSEDKNITLSADNITVSTYFEDADISPGSIKCDQMRCHWRNIVKYITYKSQIQLKHRPIDYQFCSSENNWKTIEGVVESNETNLKNYFYSDVRLSVWLTNSAGRGKQAFSKHQHTSKAAPKNKVELDCSQDAYCDYKIEEDCFKINGPNLTLAYLIHPKNQTLVNLYNHSKLEGSRHINEIKDMEGRVEFPKTMLYHTDYSASVNLSNSGGQGKQTIRYFKTKSKAPRKVQNLKNVTSAGTSIVIRWEDPPSLPPTGELEYFEITWSTYYGNKDSNKGYIKAEPGTMREYSIQNLKHNTSYVIKVQAKNRNVETLSPPLETRAKTDIKRPEPPRSFTRLENIDSLHFSIHPSQTNETTKYQMNITGKDVNSVIKCSDSKIKPICKAEKLREGSKYVVSFRSCYDDAICSGWVLMKTIWTKPSMPSEISPPTLNEVDTTEKVVCVDIPSIKENGHLYIVETISSSSLPDIDFKEKIKTCHSNVTTREKCSCSNDNKSFRICQVKEREPFCSKELEYGNKLSFATVFITTAGYHNPTMRSDFSQPFEPYYGGAQEDIGIGFGVTGCIVFIVSLIIVILRMRKQKEVEEANEKKTPMQLDFTGMGTRQNHSSSNQRKTLHSPPRERVIIIPPKILEDDEPPYYDDILPEIGNTRFDASQAEITIAQAINSPDLLSEFQSVPVYFNGMSSFLGTMDHNLRKNRYKNNLPYDETRVILPIQNEDPSTDYINASFIDTPYREKAFIASQGPKCDAYVDTRTDFFRMIWATDASHVIMVANLIEGGRTKVSQYWPDSHHKPTFFGNISVTLESSNKMMDFIERNLTLLWNGQQKQVTQFQYTAWPDHGIPSSCYSLCQMLKMIISQSEINRPIIAHCSAGIGRTGTILFVLQVLEQLVNGYIDILEALYFLRRGRPKLIENVHQYRFGHKLILECITMETRNHPYPVFEELVNAVSDQQLAQVFGTLKEMPSNLTYTIASDKAFSHLNRNNEIIPPDSKLIYIAGYGTTETDQYINAVRVDAFDRENAFISMEHPTPDTLEKVWFLIYQNQIPIWIILNEFPENDKEFPSVLSSSQLTNSNVLSLECLSSASTDAFEDCDVAIHSFQEKKSHKCRLIRLRGWPYGSEEPKDQTCIFAAVQILSSIISKQPSLISCGDGVTACGLFVALVHILQRFETTQEINVYNSVMNILFSRPQFITSLNQYKYLHRAVASYIKGFSIYSNYT